MIKKSIRNSVAIGSVGLSSLATNTLVSAAEQDKPAVTMVMSSIEKLRKFHTRLKLRMTHRCQKVSVK